MKVLISVGTAFWKKIWERIKGPILPVWNFIIHIFDDDIIGIAAQTAFFLLLAIFPLALFATSFISRFQGSAPYWATGIIPDELFALLEGAQLPEFKSPWLFAMSAWSASAGVWALMRGISRAYTGKPLTSPGARLMAIVYTIGFAAVLAITLTLLVFGQWFTLVGSASAIFLLLFALYKWAPGSTATPVRAVWTAALATIGWLAVSRVFEIYLLYFANYTVLYGSIGAFVGLALWVFLISVVVVLGAQLSAYMPKVRSSGLK